MMAERRTSNGGDVVINVPEKEGSIGPALSPSSHVAASPNSDTGTEKLEPLTIPLPEINKLTFSGNLHKPPKIPSPITEGLTRRRSLSRSVYSKSNSRFGQSYHFDKTIVEENCATTPTEPFDAALFSKHSLNKASPSNKSNKSTGSAAATPSRVDEDETDENEEIYKKVKLHQVKRKGIRPLALIELLVFVAILCTLVVFLTNDSVKKHRIWGLEVWKWCVLVMVTISGMFVTNWFMHFAVFIIERNYLLRKKVLYFVHSLKKNVQVFIWFGLILVAWVFLFEDDDQHSRKAKKFLDSITWTLISLLVGSAIFLVKRYALKVLASKFNVRNFFERIQESVFHQYVLQTLSGPPLIEEAERVGRVPSTGHLSFTSNDGTVEEKKVLDMGKVHKMKQEKVSAWTMRVLIEAVGAPRLSTISHTLDESSNRKKRSDKEITNEMEAVAVAYDIFNNVAQPNSSYIEEDDLLRFMIKEEVDLVLPLIECSETGKITRKAFTEWVIKVYTSRKALGHSLNDTKTAVNQVDKILTGVLSVITFIIWLILMDIATTKFLVVFSSQFVGLAFMIGSTCKNIFESFVFVFVMHPYDVGDRCIIDGVILLVEEIDLLTTVFLKIDNEKVFYPNATLISKPISNFYRSPDMGDSILFSIAFSTPAAKIATLKETISEYLVHNPQNWYPNFLFLVDAIENVNKLNLNLIVTHTINFQLFVEKRLRRTELVIAVKRILEELEIEYTLLPQDVHLIGHK
ncbi:Mechanosensitive ion channel protein 9 [Raphanus sativus]|uniref:Mechanosensitive ion channel protein n=1 Tax=Raphanus sativus TaxID=3726 RepID=A0A6J0MG33_RAPSA|nr:mechanosensitive ion channel protein 9 [Raphanus sativus]XP_018470482.2 mechanosensitive ion channel protein 9 [Raphanus sativus]KAJ4910753.1 Mechanosensitive ion channel protein 9 [Raphanus sativus]